MEIKITQDNANQRLDRFLRKYCKKYPQVSLSDIYKGIRKGLIKLNDRKAKENAFVQEGDIVRFDDKFILGNYDPKASMSIKERQVKHIDPKKLKSRIIYEDNEWIVFNKPAGVVMHESKDHYKDLSMNDYLDIYLNQNLGAKSDTFKASFGYRLDKDTTGLLIGAKTYNSLQYINEVIRDRNVDKFYLAIVQGKFPQKLTMNKSLERVYDDKFEKAKVKVSKEGKDSITEALLIKTIKNELLGDISLLKVQIKTGRMHQIRVHLADAGYPILGDLMYGNPIINRKLYKQIGIKRQLLHCWKYSFYDKISQENKSREAAIPEDFESLLGHALLS